MPERSLPLTCIFLCKADHCLLALRNARQHFITVWGGLLNSKVTNRKHKNVKTGFHRRAEARSFALLDLSWKLACQLTWIFLCSVYFCDWPQKCPKYWFGGYQYSMASSWICKYKICKLWSTLWIWFYTLLF